MALKVLMAAMSLDIGGAETHIIELALEMKRRGFEVSVASNGGVYTALLEQNAITHHSVPMNRRSPMYMLKSYFMLRKIIKHIKPDIVHAHARIPGFICGLIRKTQRFKFVTTAHFDFSVGHGLKYLTNWGEKTIAVSEDIKRYLMENYKINDADILVSINGIDTSKFSPDVSPEKIISEFNIDTSKPVICNISRLDENAAFASRLLIDIAPQLDLLMPGIRIIIVGSGNIYEELQIKAQEVNTKTGKATVTLTGARTDVELFLAVCSLFVGVSRAALEALSATRPVIAAGNEGYAGLFNPENTKTAFETNFTFRGTKPPTQDDLLNDITGFFKLPDSQRRKLGRVGRSLVINNYSISKMTDDTLRCYDLALTRKKRVLLSGYYGYKNAGDEAILQSIHKSINVACDNVSVTVLSSDPQDTFSRYGYTAVNRFKLFSVLKALLTCDVCVSGGGSLMQDYTSTRSLLYYLFIINTAKRFGKKVMIYSNGIGPVSKRSNRRKTVRAVNRADVITLRDSDSRDELIAMGVKRRDMHVTADPVFTMRGAAAADSQELLEAAGIPTDAPFVLVSIRDSRETDSFPEQIAALCDMICKQTGRNIVFMPMQTGRDTDVSVKAATHMNCPSHILSGRYSAEQLLAIIAEADLVIAMRLHALIFAACMSVPLLGIVYDPKVSSYLELLNMPSAGTVAEFNADGAYDRVCEVFKNSDNLRTELQERSKSLETIASLDPKLLKSLLEQ